jgi:serine kinase of HPr protein (carbohydrate metabolism regulator)
MNLREIIKKLDLGIVCGQEYLDKEVTVGYMSDLLSDVMGNARPGDLWITLQIHPNIVGVAVLKKLAGVILINNREPEEETVKKAAAEKVPLLTSRLPAFEVVGRLYEMGVGGQH